MLQLLPETFVGSLTRLVPLVKLISEEMGVAFEAWFMQPPPWRQPEALPSERLPTNCQVSEVSEPLRCILP